MVTGISVPGFWSRTGAREGSARSPASRCDRRSPLPRRRDLRSALVTARSRRPACLYKWLNRATEQKLVRREGAGRKDDPFRYRLPNADDEYWDRGELPPLWDLWER